MFYVYDYIIVIIDGLLDLEYRRGYLYKGWRIKKTHTVSALSEPCLH